LGWLKGGLSPAEAYQQRGAAHYRARCYLQSRADAASAVEALHEERRRQEGEGRGAASADALHAKRRQQGARRWDEAGWRLRLAAAYRLLGEACMAEAKHPDRDPRGATKAYLRAAELDPEHEAVHDKLSDASEDVSAAVMDQVGPRYGVPLKGCLRRRWRRRKQGGGKLLFRLVACACYKTFAKCFAGP
jgi:hypothetical protein